MDVSFVICPQLQSGMPSEVNNAGQFLSTDDAEYSQVALSPEDTPGGIYGILSPESEDLPVSKLFASFLAPP